MARQVKVEFVGSARDLAAAGLEGQLVLEGFAASAEAVETQMSAWKQATTAVGNAIGALQSASAYVMPVLIGLAAIITFTLTPAITFLVGELGALALGAAPLFALGGLAAIFTELEVSTGRWASSTAAVTAAQAALTNAQQAVANATRPTAAQLQNLAEKQDLYNAAVKAADNPLARMTTSLSAVADELAQRAAPALGVLFGWLNDLVPKGQEFADRAVDWFSKELPGALKELQGIFDAVGPIIQDIINTVGKAFENQLGHPKSFQQAVEVAFSQVRGAINQLLDWLSRLSAWWESDGKRFAADAQTDFTILAGIVEALAGVFRVLADEAHAAGSAISAVGTLAHNVESSGAVAFLGGLGDALSHQYGGSSPGGSWFVAGEAGPELGYARPGGGVTFFPGGHAGAPAGGPTYNVTVNTTQPVSERRLVDYLREAELLYGRR